MVLIYIQKSESAKPFSGINLNNVIFIPICFPGDDNGMHCRKKIKCFLSDAGVAFFPSKTIDLGDFYSENIHGAISRTGNERVRVCLLVSLTCGCHRDPRLVVVIQDCTLRPHLVISPGF